MTYAVFYYTRTNTSKRVAEKIATTLSCDLVQITDNINWRGIFGFIRAGRFSAQNKHVNIEINGNMDNIDEYILVAPLWAGGIAPAAKTFLEMVPADRVHLVVTSLGSLEKNHEGYKSIHDIRRFAKNEDQAIKDIVKQLKGV